MKKGRSEWKVLLIDDDEGVRRVTSIILADAGYCVLAAESGQSGLKLCKEESPQIVITDIRMPGMDGMEVLRTVKKEDPDKEVIVVTGFGEMAAAVSALQLDASDFITKPIGTDALLIALERAKKRYSTRKELQAYTALLEERWVSTADELAKAIHYRENLIESSIDGILGSDREGRIVIYNQSIENILRYPKEMVIGKMHFTDLFPPGGVESFKEALDSERYGGRHRLFLYETNLSGQGGQKVPVQLSASVLFEVTNEIGMVCFIRDLRRLRMMEEQFADQERLLHQDKMITLGRLSASVVHEINNPLAGILNYLRLMIKILDRGTPNHEQMEKFGRYLELAESETGRCSRMVSSLLAFSRKTETEFKEIDICELLERCIMLSRHKLDLQGIRIENSVEPDIPRIRGDFNQIQQCLVNLIFNAVDAMPEGGTLTIACARDRYKNGLEVRVTDTGCGISREDLPLVFDPFYTTKKEGKGLGLGLSTVQGIIERHKGKITVESEKGKGTTFFIRLPV
ncbi:MAG: response regulator [Desulfobacteraceae bacterium]|nr:MAG: response regulator [Desulfobacteraceae bacterium]